MLGLLLLSCAEHSKRVVGYSRISSTPEFKYGPSCRQKFKCQYTRSFLITDQISSSDGEESNSGGSTIAWLSYVCAEITRSKHDYKQKVKFTKNK